jgi:polyvinyl alcohol dehydrogenase (cytochrome)
MHQAARIYLLLTFAAGILFFARHSALGQSNEPSQSDGESLFEQNCAVCHNNPATRAPSRGSLGAMSPAFIIEALTNGIMGSQGLALSAEQRVSLAEFLSGRKVGAEILMAGRCEFPPSPFSPEGSMFNGWGASVENWRFQPEPGISAAQLGRLELKWAFGIPGVVTMFGQPTLAGSRVFIGGQNGMSIRSTCGQAVISGTMRRAPA